MSQKLQKSKRTRTPTSGEASAWASDHSIWWGLNEATHSDTLHFNHIIFTKVFTGNSRPVFKLKLENNAKTSLCRQMLSLLPSRVLRLMEFLGFSGDRVSVDLVQPCRLFWTLLFPTVMSFEHAYHFPGARFVRAETGSSEQQPAVYPQHLDSPHVPSLHYCHPG